MITNSLSNRFILVELIPLDKCSSAHRQTVARKMLEMLKNCLHS